MSKDLTMTTAESKFVLKKPLDVRSTVNLFCRLHNYWWSNRANSLYKLEEESHRALSQWVGRGMPEEEGPVNWIYLQSKFREYLEDLLVEEVTGV